MSSDPGETCHPWTTHYIVHVQVNSKETTKDLWLSQKDNSLSQEYHVLTVLKYKK